MKGSARATCLALTLVMLVVPLSARAHGRLPATGEIAFHPSDPDVIVVRTTFGVLVTTDGGQTFRWVCIEALGDAIGGRVLDAEDPPIAITGEGVLLVGLFGGLALGDPNGCSFGPSIDALKGTIVIDVEIDPSDPGHAFALTSAGGRQNGLFASDGGDFAPVNAEIDAILFETVRVAPSRPSRVYLTGATGRTPNEAFVYRSDDGGESFEKIPFPLDEDGRNVRLLAVHPTDEDVLYARVDGVILEQTVSGNDRKADDRLVVSEDGGGTWRELLSLPLLNGFAIREDGSEIFAGGRGSGLYRATDGGELERIERFLEVSCLAFRGDELWVCGDNFADGFALGRSTDHGDSFEPVLQFMDVQGLVTCEEGSATRRSCEKCLFDLVTDLGLDPAISPNGSTATCYDGGIDGGGALDAGRDAGEGDDEGGCDCAVGSRRRLPMLPVALLALAGLGRRRRLTARRGRMQSRAR